MPNTDLKQLHKDWQKAKKSAKVVFDAWDRMHTDLSEAHEDVKFSNPSFPKFNLDLGPSLENIEKKKDLDKYKKKADKAVDQYKSDISQLLKAVKKTEVPKDPKQKQIHNSLVIYLGQLEDVRKEIEKALEKVDSK